MVVGNDDAQWWLQLYCPHEWGLQIVQIVMTLVSLVAVVIGSVVVFLVLKFVERWCW